MYYYSMNTMLKMTQVHPVSVSSLWEDKHEALVVCAEKCQYIKKNAKKYKKNPIKNKAIKHSHIWLWGILQITKFI